MAGEILALAILEPVHGKEDELVTYLQDFYALLQRKGYSRDTLFRDATRPGSFVHLRYWKSAEARAEAQHDPEVHKYWQGLPDLCSINTVYEDLQTIVKFEPAS